MVWVRRLGWVLAALAALLVLAAAIGLALFDADRTKQLAIDAVRERWQRTLVIGQPIELSVFPRPRLRLGGLSLSERGRSETFARVASAEVEPQLWPLLRGRIVVDRIELQGVQATLLRRRDGSRNTDDLAGAPASGGAAPAALAIGRIRLRDLTLQLQDQGGGPPVQVAVALLEAGRIAATEGRVSAAPVVLELSRLQRGDLALAGSRLEVARLEAGGTPRALVLEGLTLALAGRQGAAGFEAGLRWPRLSLKGEQVEGAPLEGEFKVTGPSTLTGRLRSGPPAGDLKTLRLPELTLEAKGHAGEHEITAALKAALALQSPADAPGPTLQWTLQGRLNDNRLSSDGQLRFGAAVPVVRASARFDRLDLNRLAGAGGARSASAPPPPAGTAADPPIPLEGLRAVDGTLTLSAGTLLARQVQVADARVDAQLQGGLLRVTRLSGQAWGGQIDGRGSADANGRRFALALTAANVDVHALLRDVAAKDLLAGRGRVSADLRAQGATLGALRSTLAGTASVQLRDGAVKGLNLARAFRQARAAMSGRADAVTQARATEQTDFSELSASARLDGGVATSDDLALKSPFLRVGGAGRFDIGRGRIDYTARATVVEVPAGQDGAELAALKGVTVPVRLTGPFDAIDWRIQWSEVAEAALKEKAQQKLERKLGDKLRGLLGR